MAIDKLTQDYFGHDFPGWDHSTPVEIPKNPFFTQVPFVELDVGIDVDYLKGLMQKILPVDYGKESREHRSYQKEKRIKGWDCNKVLWNHGNRPTYALTIRNKEMVPTPPIVEPGETELQIENYLKSKNFYYKILLHMTLVPDSYLRPHRDFSDNWPLLYSWIPITYPEGAELKFYPLGTAKIKLGCVYLFNQYHFTHAIRNTNLDLSRDCLIGHLDEDMHNNSEFKSQVVEAISQQYGISDLTNN